MEEQQTDIFSKETTYTSSPVMIVKFLILQYRDLCFKRWLFWLDQREGSSGMETGERRFKSSLMVLYEQLRTRLMKQKEYADKKIVEMIKEKPGDAFSVLNDYMEEDLKITKIDTRNHVDLDSIHERNKAFLGM